MIEQNDLFGAVTGVAPKVFDVVPVRAHTRIVSARKPKERLDMKAAHEKGAEGAKRAAEHADRVRAEWTELAYAEFCRWVSLSEKPFLSEEFVGDMMRSMNVPDPPDPRAWGHVVKRASRNGIIRREGFAPAASSHGSAKPLWVRA